MRGLHQTHGQLIGTATSTVMARFQLARASATVVFLPSCCCNAAGCIYCLLRPQLTVNLAEFRSILFTQYRDIVPNLDSISNRGRRIKRHERVRPFAPEAFTLQVSFAALPEAWDRSLNYRPRTAF
jgi:hypothetical protein